MWQITANVGHMAKNCSVVDGKLCMSRYNVATRECDMTENTTIPCSIRDDAVAKNTSRISNASTMQLKPANKIEEVVYRNEFSCGSVMTAAAT